MLLPNPVKKRNKDHASSARIASHNMQWRIRPCVATAASEATSNSSQATSIQLRQILRENSSDAHIVSGKAT